MKKEIANWGNYPVMKSDEHSFTYLQDMLDYVPSADGWIARGNGRCYGDASLSPNTINTTKFDKILSFDAEKGVFECQSGVMLDRVLEVIVPKGWFLPVTPGTKFITVGGAVASDVHGKNHHVDGSFSHHIMEMDILLSDGALLTCTPDEHADLFEATCGGMGLTGLITRVKFDLKKIETSYIRQKQIKADNLEEMLRLFDEYSHFTYSVAWIDCLKKGEHFGRGILMFGEHATVAELNDRQKQDPLRLPAKKQISFPFNLPSWALNKLTVKAFNRVYYAKNMRKVIDNVVNYEPFFYPLDVVLHWNRGYGKKGFVQYQFVLPPDRKDGLISIMKRINERGMGSFLSVFKLFGKQDSMIGFPMEGYTLALDFPIRDGLFEFMNELDEMVLQYGGRIYMSKDARMQPGTLQAGYKRLPQFLSVIRKYDPQGRIRSVQSDRLLLTKPSTN